MDDIEAVFESRGQLDRKMANNKRLRSWDVEVSLDDLVEWDALEQFMSEIPAADGPSQQGGAGSSQHAMRQAYGGAASGGRNSADSVGFSACGGAGGRAFPSLVPGAWPMAGGLDGGLTSSSMVAPNAATLAASLYPSWQQGLAAQAPYKMQALPMERGVSWGAELLPFIDEGEAGPLMSALSNNTGLDSPPRGDDGRHDGMLGGAGMMQRPGGGGGGGGGGGMPDDGSGAAGRPVHKQRFVWTSELHRRFEAAVNTLGVDQAKPQAISQLMNCEGEGAPTRQNIKSHLQKYRLLIQKRQRQGGSGDGAGGAGDKAGDSAGGSASGTGASDQTPTDVQSELEQHLARQEMNLRVQMDLQTKLHRQLLVQRQLQHQLEHCFPTQGSDADKDKQRYQATLQLKNSLRERLTTHVMLQQEMLQHLDALVSSEVTKSADESSAEPPEAGAASVDTTSDAVDTIAGEVEKAEPSGETAA